MTNSSPARGPRNIVLLLAYDGTDFSGWQTLEKRDPPGTVISGTVTSGTVAASAVPRTVQGELERALKKLHKHPVTLTGSGRTDAGVHARGQAANFYTDIRGMEAGRFVPALNSLLPRDVRVMEAREAAEAFHARFDARSRTYRYFFLCGRGAAPAERRYALPLSRRPDLSLLAEYCRFFRGEFDCTVFASPADTSRSRRRYIYGASFYPEGDKLVFEIRANAFLWKMVRSLSGTLLHCEKKGLAPERFRELAGSGKRELAGPTLPPEGLFLWHVGY
ncbi:MAG: tRNA pseudouridine synthase A [Spirochaetaceae bacterium]|jgi:tRNA pseudouridine38-40 synthase|nr:tRNA pseudouridine synthase A [Spirochaetaceae bacterium]